MAEGKELKRESAPDDRPGRRVALVLLPFLFGIVAGVAGQRALPSAVRDIGPAVVSATARVGNGQTVVRVPLLGSISAKTHSAPLEISLSVDEVDPNAVQEAFRSVRSREELTSRLRRGLGEGARHLAVRGILGGGILGALAALILPHRRPWWAALGAAGGLLSASLLFGLTAREFNVGAFEEPRFNGPVERAPEIIEAVQRRAGSIRDLRSRFSAGAGRLSQVLALANRPLDNPHSGTVAILHISDVHSNPLGLELAKQLAVSFKVDAIVDTGDLTSFGEPIEGRIGELIPSMPVPYLVVPGNHDSDANRTTLARTPNVTLLHDTVAEIKGVRVMGWSDPAFTAKNGLSQAEADNLQRDRAPVVASRAGELRPHVLAVHSRLLARDAMGQVPLILAGHRHRQRNETEGGTRLLEVGSTGATGLGSFLVQGDRDYEAQIVYFRDTRAVALDYIRLRGFGADFTVQRQTLEEEPGEES